MEEFLKRTFGLLSLLIALLIFTPLAVIPADKAVEYPQTFNLFPLDTLSPDVLFLGSSTLAFGLDEEVLSARGIDFFSFGLHGGSGPSYIFHETSDVRAKSNMTILSPSPPWLLEPNLQPEVPALLSHSKMGASHVLQAYGLETFILTKAWALSHYLRPWRSYYQESETLSSFKFTSDCVGKRGVVMNHLKSTESVRGDIDNPYAAAERVFDPNFWENDSYSTTHTALDLDYWKSQANHFSHILPIPIRRSQNATLYAENVHKLSVALQKPLLLDPESCVFPDSLFFDEWHLNKAGGQIYSEMIASAPLLNL